MDLEWILNGSWMPDAVLVGSWILNARGTRQRHKWTVDWIWCEKRFHPYCIALQAPTDPPTNPNSIISIINYRTTTAQKKFKVEIGKELVEHWYSWNGLDVLAFSPKPYRVSRSALFLWEDE